MLTPFWGECGRVSACTRGESVVLPSAERPHRCGVVVRKGERVVQHVPADQFLDFLLFGLWVNGERVEQDVDLILGLGPPVGALASSARSRTRPPMRASSGMGAAQPGRWARAAQNKRALVNVPCLHIHLGIHVRAARPSPPRSRWLSSAAPSESARNRQALTSFSAPPGSMLKCRACNGPRRVRVAARTAAATV